MYSTFRTERSEPSWRSCAGRVESGLSRVIPLVCCVMLEDRPEISDLIVDYDVDTLARRPVKKSDVIARLSHFDMRRAVRIVEDLPETVDGALDPNTIDTLLVRVHTELQRLSEEFQQGRRVLRMLAPCIACLRQTKVPKPIRVVDVGCGLGYVVRWLAALGNLGEDVELVGCDYNKALVSVANRLAEEENLKCRFLTQNAFALQEPGTIFISTGVIHHFRGAELTTFFAMQARATTQAFFHFDILPSCISPIGAWMFHAARMREQLSRHDGVLSAKRAHSKATLTSHAKRGAPGFKYSFAKINHVGHLLVRVLRPIIGIRPEILEPFSSELGTLTRRIEAFQ